MEEVKEAITDLNEKGAAETDKPPSCRSIHNPGDIHFYLERLTDRSLPQFSNYDNQKAPIRGL